VSSTAEIDNPSAAGTGGDAANLRSPQLLNLPPLNRRATTGSARLSFAQERLWFLDQLTPGDVQANLSLGWRLNGALNVEALKQALHAVVVRHDILRTAFVKNEHFAGTDGQPMQLTTETVTVDLTSIDLSHEPEAERENQARGLARAEAQKPFDLSLGPLLRLELLTLADSDHILLLSMHRIVADKASLEIFHGELWECYRAFVNHEDPRLEELPVQFADYANWQCEWHQGVALQEQIDYWTSTLAHAPSLIELPLDHPRPVVQSSNGGLMTAVLDDELTSGLRSLARAADVSLFTLALTAFQLLLSRSSGQSTVMVGSRTVNRELRGTERLIGPLANALALRADLPANCPFLELLARVDASVVAAQAHQAVPFETLLQGLSVERSLSHTPLFQVMLDLSRPLQRVDTPGLSVTEFVFDDGIALFDLSLDLVDAETDITCRLTYNTDLFEGQTALRLLEHFVVLLQSVVANPGHRIGDLDILTARERDLVLTEWNSTKVDYPRGRTFPELFEEQAEKTPAAIAVVFADQQISYGELNHRANQLAVYLRQRGVEPEEIVGLFLPRSIDLVVGLLAVLKAGGAYLPLDRAYPPERLSFMLQDAGVSLVLTHTEWEASLPTSVDVIVLNRDLPTSSAIKQQLAPVAVGDNLVYVIYTSGSTGKPKGVMVTHDGLMNYLNWCTEAYAVRTGNGSLVHSPLSFDLTVTSLLAPLFCGQRVTLLSEAPGLDALSNAVSQNSDYSLLKITPAHLEGLGYLLRPEEANGSARALIVGGEALLAESIAFWREAAPGTRIINEYGPTETVVGCCVHEVSASDPLTGPVPIGRPIANTEIYLLDANLQPAPIGVSGEIHIGGNGVARGYLRRPELTAANFLPNPFSSVPGSRLYKTGDRARYLPNGCIQFLGRNDEQVKIRGHRIELEEIETALLQHQGVRDCAVSVSTQAGRGKEVVAYVVLELETTTTDELRDFLRTRLPEYMVPAAFITLDTLPLTPNGKLDRRALPALDQSRSQSRTVYVAPRDHLEEQLANVWQKVLGIDQVGVQENFFELGGHSLLAARMFAQIENRFGKRLPLGTLFQAPTIEQLARVLAAAESERPWSSLVAIQPLGSRPPLFCVHAGGANVLIYRPLARRLGNDQPLYALQAQGLDGRSEPFARVEQMAAHYLKEIRSVQPHGPYRLLGASFGGLVVFEMALQLLNLGQQVDLLAMLNTNCPVYTPLQKLRCHLGHFKQFGVRGYSSNVFRALRARVRPVSQKSDTGLADQELTKILETRADKDDPLIKTVFGIIEASQTYLPAKSYPGQITFFWAQDAERDFEDNRTGWRRLAGGFELHTIPGDHGTMREEPNIAVLVEKLKLAL
jgi:aspartate racemase